MALKFLEYQASVFASVKPTSVYFQIDTNCFASSHYMTYHVGYSRYKMHPPLIMEWTEWDIFRAQRMNQDSSQ